jgi:uncharacterized membrane protein YedE/YeeE
MFEPLPRLLLGLVTGIVFGFLLQKGRVAKYRVIVGQFLLQDFTVVKIMATAVVVGAVGIYAMQPTGWADLHIKPLLLGGVLVGGALFGIGMGLLGYCPGTSVAACGEGRRDAMIGVLGGLIGSAIFVAAYPWLQPLRQWGDYGEVTLPDVTNSSPWLWITILAAVVATVFLLVARRGPRGYAEAETRAGGHGQPSR